MSLIFIIVLTLLLLSDAYIIFGVLSNLMTGWSWYPKTFLYILILLPTLLYCILIVKVFLFDDVSQHMLNNLFRGTLLVVLSTILFTLISLIGKGIGLLWPGATTIFNAIGLAVVIGWISIVVYGCIEGWKKVTVERVSIASSKLPEAFNGYKIVQLSDFHIGTYADSPETVDKIVNEVNALNPDLIVFTGDLVNSASDEITQFKTALSKLKARDGILSVLGNHDYCLYREYKAPDTPDKQLAKVISNEEEVGWRMLRNDAYIIKRGNDSIAIVGVDNAGSRMFPDKSDLPKAVKGLSADDFKILLSHDPSHWRREVLPTTDIDLTLSGHTHAMQFKIGNWSPSKWTYPEWGGLYVEGNQKLYVSTGIGENIAFRFGAWPQIVLLTLCSKN
ncbi:MAG: metallophosphoesterase [Muribaculaceae bacterium]|nr:metallophosphoesterase [Muribaculaceae bacterium]